jgi:hypothetical protein
MIPLILAEGIPPPDPQFFYSFLGACSVVAGGLIAWKKIQREPPIDVDLEKLATKEALLLSERARDAKIEALRVDSESKVAALREEINQRLTGLSSKFDRLRDEIRLDRKEDREAAEQRVRLLQANIDAVRDGQTADTKAILKELGKIQGEMHT